MPGARVTCTHVTTVPSRPVRTALTPFGCLATTDGMAIGMTVFFVSRAVECTVFGPVALGSRSNLFQSVS